MSIRSVELIRMAGISYRQLDYWSRRGFIETKHPGYGRHRQWDPAEVERTVMLARLVHAGLDPEWAVRWVPPLLSGGYAHPAPGLLLSVTRHG
jgi:hypothetical protein